MHHQFLVFLAALALVSISVANAAPKEKSQTNFFEQKQKIIERLKQRLTCISAAQNETQLQACRASNNNDGALGRDSLFKGSGQDVIR